MRAIVWSNKAALFFLDAIDQMKESSPANAQKVSEVILQKIESAAVFPEQQRRDKYKKDNDAGLSRAFELYSFRISFYFNDEILRIVRVRHTRQKPLKY